MPSRATRRRAEARLQDAPRTLEENRTHSAYRRTSRRRYATLPQWLGTARLPRSSLPPSSGKLAAFSVSMQ
jgi:hypothetical protein